MSKVIFLDIDGTLTSPGSNVPPESALRAVRSAQAAGHKVFLCTGRNPGMLSPLLGYGFDGYIGSSGGLIVCGDEVIYDCPMTEKQRVTAMESLAESGVFRTVECRTDSYTDEAFKDFLKSVSGGNSELLRWREQIEKSLNIRPMKEYEGQPVYKMVLMFSSMSQLERPRQLLEDEFAFVIQERNGAGIYNGDLVNRSFDKGKGVARVCGYLGIPLEDSIGFGDSNNDREMLETVGISVCMANGSSEMKKLADRICPAVEEDGLYQAFCELELMQTP